MKCFLHASPLTLTLEGFPHRPGGVLLPGEEVRDRGRGGGRRLRRERRRIRALKRSLLFSQLFQPKREGDCKVQDFFFFFSPRQTSEWKPAGSQLIYCFRGVFTLPWCPVGLCSALTRHIPPRNETDWLLRRPHSILLTTLALRETFSASLQTFTVHLFRNSENVTFELIYKLEIALTRLFSWHLCENITIQLLFFSFFFAPK